MTIEATEAYAALEARFRRLALLDEIGGMLEWDRVTIMPPGGAETRADQIAELALVRREFMTDARVGAWLDEAEAGARALPRARRRNLTEMRRRWRHAAAVPPELQEAATRARLSCEMAWREARAKDDFPALAPLLEEVVRLTRETAQAKGEALGCAPYDALLDSWQPGLRTVDFEPLFADLAAFLPGFIEEALERQARRPAPEAPHGPFPVAAQRALAEKLMTAVGFPFANGRLDETEHPFSGGAPDDLRITTRYDENDFSASMMAVLHETGHALYEHNLPRRWRLMPIGDALGMAVHESQSLIMEMQACRSREFFAFAAPIVRRIFSSAGPAWEADNLYRAATRVARTVIRVYADEATYPAHILLRASLERELLSGALAVRDLPAAWREGMQGLLGVAPDTDRDGCMQDIHWMDGAFGYFPTYALGAMLAAQLFAAARAAEPQIVPSLARGDFAPLLGWLKTNVHEHGSLLTVDELMERATGRPLDPAAYTAHLRTRYLN